MVRDRMSLEVQLAPYKLNPYIQETSDEDGTDGIPTTGGYSMDALGHQELGAETGDDTGYTFGAQFSTALTDGIITNDGKATGENGYILTLVVGVGHNTGYPAEGDDIGYPTGAAAGDCTGQEGYENGTHTGGYR